MLSCVDVCAEIFVLPFDYLRRFHLETTLPSNVYLCTYLLTMRIILLLLTPLTVTLMNDLNLEYFPIWISTSRVAAPAS